MKYYYKSNMIIKCTASMQTCVINIRSSAAWCICVCCCTESCDRRCDRRLPDYPHRKLSFLKLNFHILGKVRHVVPISEPAL